MSAFGHTKLVERVTHEDKTLAEELISLWHHIGPSIDSVHLVFPEYTPHNTTHLNRLFDLSHSILSPNIIESLNTTEAFLLAASIISHDWGMGVSLKEQQSIIEGKKGIICWDGPDGIQIQQPLLNNESQRLINYSLSNSIEFKWNSGAGSLANPDHLEHWRNYLRETHPERSAARILHYFQTKNKHLGEVIASIVHGHGRETSEIEDPTEYPTELALNGAIVNIQAITLYLRLTDLIDIGKGRTPYELWRFINPGNQRSAIEWKKHQAMDEPVFTDDFIEFTANPTESSILAEIFNLRAVCDQELAWQFQLLKNSKPLYHYRRAYAKWFINPLNGIHATAVRFDFSRTDLLHLLSEEIYDGDPYVFLRELLQNSIDAIKTRKASSNTPNSDINQNDDIITIDAGVDSLNRSIVTVTDKGTGMTEYVIQNYLSIVGKSFYQSSDFKKLNPQFDPISRFGIGLLSCFSVAEKVIIKTKTRTQDSVAAQAWEIEIGTGLNGLPIGHWEWKHLNPTSIEAGTQVQVVIAPEKLVAQTSHLDKNRPNLQITEYIKVISVFTAFPILITESKNKTLILPQGIDYRISENNFTDAEIFQKKLKYDFAEHINAAHIDSASKCLEIVNIEISTLGIPNIRGIISYPKPRQSWRVIARSGQSITLQHQDGEEITLNGPVWNSGNSGFMEHFQSSGLSKSSKAFNRSAVYNQGILLSGALTPADLGTGRKYKSSILPHPNLYINYTRPDSTNRTGPSRTNLRYADSKWPNEILDAHARQIAKSSRDNLLSLAPRERLIKILQILEQDFVTQKALASGFEWDEWPIPILTGEGTVEVRLLRDIKKIAEITEAPRVIAKIASQILRCSLDNQPMHTFSLKNWSSRLCFFKIHFEGPFDPGEYTSEIIKQYFSPKVAPIALTSPRLKDKITQLPPFFAHVWSNAPGIKIDRFSPAETMRSIELLKVGITHPHAVPSEDLIKITHLIPTSLKFVSCGNQLPRAFKKYLLWSADSVNVDHPIGAAICQVYCAYATGRLDKSLMPIESARLEKLLAGLRIATYSNIDPNPQKKNSLIQLNRHLEDLIVCTRECTSLAGMQLPDIKADKSDFLPGAFHFFDSDSFQCLSFEGDLIGKSLFENETSEDAFGMLLGASSAWPPTTSAETSGPIKNLKGLRKLFSFLLNRS